MSVNASERQDVPLRTLSGDHGEGWLEMKIWENEKVSMLPVSKDVSMDEVWAAGRERVNEIKIEVEVVAEVEIQRKREEKERERIHRRLW